MRRMMLAQAAIAAGKDAYTAYRAGAAREL
jgi:hypothetical protein